jgi:hypothetical protein
MFWFKKKVAPRPEEIIKEIADSQAKVEAASGKDDWTIGGNVVGRPSQFTVVEGMERYLREHPKIRADEQGRCLHKSGGMAGPNRGRTAREAMLNGTDAFYAVIKHVLPTGQLFVVCQRCGKEWFSTNPFDPSFQETPGFKEAWNFPTRNCTSSSTQFWPPRVAPSVKFEQPQTIPLIEPKKPRKKVAKKRVKRG